MLYITLLTIILGLLPSLPKENIGQACLSKEEKKLFDLINAYRETKDLYTVQFSSSMTLVAQAHVRDLAENYTFKQGARCNPHSWSKKR